jgi:hypothetical protein
LSENGRAFVTCCDFIIAETDINFVGKERNMTKQVEMTEMAEIINPITSDSIVGLRSGM